MKNHLLTKTVVIAIVVCAALTAQAQNRERFGISAKAGGVNAVSGQVSVRRVGQKLERLTSNDDLASGDVVSTGAGSQVEVLLNPGSYLRLAENSEFVMSDNSLDNLLVRLTKGSAIIEATGPEGVELRIPIVTEEQRFTISRAGIYRINVVPGRTDLLVRKGRVWLGNDPRNIVKSGKKVTFTSSPALTAKLEKQDRDDFDEWSKTRGQTLARANQRLSARSLNGYLSSSQWSWPSLRFGRWGLWTWSPFSSCYTFLPFYYGWSTPYGTDYGLYAGFGGYYFGGGYRPNVYTSPVITANPSPSGGPSGFDPGGRSSGPITGTGASGGTTSAPMNSGSQAGPRDPDSGSRSVNRIKDPD